VSGPQFGQVHVLEGEADRARGTADAQVQGAAGVRGILAAALRDDDALVEPGQTRCATALRQVHRVCKRTITRNKHYHRHHHHLHHHQQQHLRLIKVFKNATWMLSNAKAHFNFVHPSTSAMLPAMRPNSQSSRSIEMKLRCSCI